MKIENNTVVRFRYGVTAPDDALLKLPANPPIINVLVGHDQLVPGLEAALLGHEAGDSFTVELKPEQAYGERREGWTQRISKKHFPRPKQLRAGQPTSLFLPDGPRAVTVLKVGMSVVDVDLNHPLAGKYLKYDIEILAVRPAEPVEIEHGHVHEEGMHHD